MNASSIGCTLLFLDLSQLRRCALNGPNVPDTATIDFPRGLQHRIHQKVLSGLYPAAELVERALAPEWGAEKAILDVGTGPGHWSVPDPIFRGAI